MFNLKLVLGVAVLAVIGGLITVQHLTVKKLRAATARANQAEANYTALQEAQKHERKIAKEASDGYQAELRRIRSEPSIGPVLVCKRTRTTVPSTSGTTGRPDATVAGRVEEAPEVDHVTDIGPELDAYGGDCEAVSAQLTSLQKWVRAR
jgi:hypothetical protein